MRLAELHDLDAQYCRVMIEGYFRVLDTRYTTPKVDPTPKIIQLGKWTHPNTGNLLVGGINLNYLTDNQIEELRYYAPEISQHKTLKSRYWAGRRLLPDIFNNYYRTYKNQNIEVVDLGTLKFMTPAELRKKGDTDRASKLQDRREVLSKLRKERQPKEPQPDIPPERPIEPKEAPEAPDTTKRAQTAVQQQQAEKDIPKAQKVPSRRMRPLAPPELEAPVPEVPEEPTPEAEVPPEVTPEEPARVPKRKMKPLQPELSNVNPEDEDLASGAGAESSGPSPNEPDEDPDSEPGAPIPSRR